MEDEVPLSISEYIVKFYARKKTKKNKGKLKHKEIVAHAEKRNIKNNENLTKGDSSQMKQSEAIFIVGVVLFFAGAIFSELLVYFGCIFILAGIAMWWIDRKKRLAKYIDQRVKAEVERQLQERKEEV